MIDVDWGDADETILIWTFQDGWTAQDFINAFGVSEEVVAQRTTRGSVHVLLDVQHTIHLPEDMFTLGRYAIKRAVDKNQRGLIVIINPSNIWNRFYEILKPMVPHTLNISFARDADEAYQKMREADEISAKNCD